MRAAFATLVIGLCLVLSGAPAHAENGLKYYQDPLFSKVSPDEPHPMDDMLSLAAQGDARAQFIMGDLYDKGQGGLGKNLVKAQYWFEVAARNAYNMAYIRLAALAKHAKDPVAAYKWYSLCKAATSWRSEENEWCDSARDNVVEHFKMTARQINAAKKAAESWQDKRGAVEKQLKAQEAKARAEAEKMAAKTEDAEKQAQAAPPKHSLSQDTYQPQQEKNYND